MRSLIRYVAWLVGPTFEDWLLAAMMIAMLALTVAGVRSCDDESSRNERARCVQSR